MNTPNDAVAQWSAIRAGAAFNRARDAKECDFEVVGASAHDRVTMATDIDEGPVWRQPGVRQDTPLLV